MPKVAKPWPRNARPVAATTMYADELELANLVAKARRETVPIVLSSLIGDRLRKLARATGIDPDKAGGKS